MSWKQIYRDMAFHPYKDELAAGRELLDSLVTLRHFLDGQARAWEALDALRHLDYVCGQPVRAANERLRRCLFWEDEEARNEVARECLAAIVGWLNRNKGARVE